MGYRLHVCKKYDVRYADIDDFDCKAGEVSRLFSLLQMDYWESAECDDFEIPREEFLEKVEYLRTLPDDDPDRDEILEVCAALDYPDPAGLADRLKKFADAADPDDDYIHFSFF